MVVKIITFFVFFPPRPEIYWCVCCWLFVFSGNWYQSTLVKLRKRLQNYYESFLFNQFFCVMNSLEKPRTGKFCHSCRRSRAKKPSAFTASGRLRLLDPLTRGSAHGPRWGLCFQTLVRGPRSTLAMGFGP